MSYEVKIDAFEGPIPLLLHLIKQEEVEIYDISISEITAQYLDYIEAMQDLNLEIASEFLVMAANLIEIKVNTLLPDESTDDEEDEIDPRQQLINRLLEYKKYKELADRLRRQEERYKKTYTRNLESILAEVDTDETEVNPLRDVSLEKFVDTFEEVITQKLEEEKEQEEDEAKDKLSHLNREEITIQDRMNKLNQQLQQEKEIGFTKLFTEDYTRLEVVVTFMALLELMKQHRVCIKQDETFGNINIRLLTE
ncbi:segregation and condensation protein A [Sporohalobacter salinus]|uniref:segregation and condensation protein A n=1 Tax=Sporohalobacter salinus TaxID=1494606 RepID=UPI00195FE437|nr:segregation/condensation protein A [Sporohalobacter salinus]MBM7623559.1 segregation and condensation protein A [Sporohalobacter salinus]